MFGRGARLCGKTLRLKKLNLRSFSSFKSTKSNNSNKKLNLVSLQKKILGNK